MLSAGDVAELWGGCGEQGWVLLTSLPALWVGRRDLEECFSLKGCRKYRTGLFLPSHCFSFPFFLS